MLFSGVRRSLKHILLLSAVLIIFLKFLYTSVSRTGRERGLIQFPATRAPPPPALNDTTAERRLPPPLGKHQFRTDGLVEVNKEGPHPIYGLISAAEWVWEGKLNRASRTLQEAVREYKKRYKRSPPKGFDLWWKYATENNVQLPDEYDQIHIDLEHFWGIEPSDLIKIQEDSELEKDSYTIGQDENGDVSVLTHAFEEGRYNQLIVGSQEIVKLLKSIQHLLPPFRMTLSPHDGPSRHTDYGVKAAALDAAAGQTYIERSALPTINPIGWISACSPNSPARRKPINLDKPPPRPAKKTFIWDHVRTMDPCNHPDLFFHHGQFLSHNNGPTPQTTLVPEFSSSSTMLHHNIRFPTPHGWIEDIYPRADDPEWDVKQDKRLLWRGSNTGMFHSTESRWQYSHRNFLVSFTNELEGTLNLLPPNRTKSEKIGGLLQLPKSKINPALMDIAFSGNPVACSAEVCKLLRSVYPWRSRQSVKEAGNYRYVLDVDGDGRSRRFKRLMTSNSLVFKSTIYPEWYVDRVAPWVHYVPIQPDLSDLHDALIFFSGDGNGDGAHEHLARKIALAGREWSKSFWRQEDLISYFFRLTLEYARLMSRDRESMTYAGTSQ